MIERFIKNDDSLKKWRRFKAHKLAVISAWLIGIALFFSFTAEFWANSKPLYLKYNNTSYFPVFKRYHPTEFGEEKTMVTDYRSLDMNEERGDFAIWPVVRWDPFESNKDVEIYPSEPSSDNWMGTDDRGREVVPK